MSDEIKYEDAVKELDEIVSKLEMVLFLLTRALNFLKKELSLQLFAVIS